MAHPEIQSNEPYAPYRFTVDEYYRMAEADILSEDDRVELLDGQLTVKEPPGPPHSAHVAKLTRLFVRLLGDRAIVRPQDPLRIDDLNHPEPDLAIVKPREDFYARAHPGPKDVLLLIEVAVSSAAGDRRIKTPLYARAGIAEFWLVDVPGLFVEVYREPNAGGFRHCERLGRDESVVPAAFPDLEIDVSEIVHPIPEA